VPRGTILGLKKEQEDCWLKMNEGNVFGWGRWPKYAISFGRRKLIDFEGEFGYWA
jgi:hypothetical protein